MMIEIVVIETVWFYCCCIGSSGGGVHVLMVGPVTCLLNGGSRERVQWK